MSNTLEADKALVFRVMRDAGKSVSAIDLRELLREHDAGLSVNVSRLKFTCKALVKDGFAKLGSNPLFLELTGKHMAQTIYRDAESGMLVTEEYARANPTTTVKEIIRERFSFAELSALALFVEANDASATFKEVPLLDIIRRVKNDTPKD